MADHRVNWEDDIKHFFTQLDIGCMRARNVDLSDYQTVKEKAVPILNQLTLRASRPNDNVGMPKGGRPWPPDKIKAFKDWKDDGFPRTATDPPPIT